jgi:hypothetical protein
MIRMIGGRVTSVGFFRFSRRAVAVLGCATAVLVSASPAYGDGVPFHVGDVLAGVGNGLIKHFDSSGNLLDTLNTTSGSRDETGMCFDSAGNLFTTNFEANTISEFDKNGNLVAASFGSGFNSSPESCVFNSAGQMFVGQADGSGQVLEFDASGNLLNSFSPAPDARGTDFIDLAADQHTLRYTSEGSLVKQFDVGTNTQLADFASGLPAPCFAHRILPNGGELVACSSEVVRLDPSGAIVQSYPVGQSLFALNVDPDGTSFWTADFSGNVYHVDIATGNVINTFNAAPPVEVAGLAIVGERTAAADPKITAVAPASVSATEGKSFSGTVATFTDPDANATASEYSATITWGDGSTSTGSITGSGGSFTVTGSHKYGEEGSNAVSVTITDADNTSNAATASTTAKVADAALHGTSGSPTRTGTNVSGTVATFTDDDPGGTVSDYTASINWGDGTTTTGTVTAGTGKFNVGGSHTYTKSGTFVVTVTIKDKGGSTTTASESVTIKIAAAVHGTARLSGVPLICVTRAFTLRIIGKRISSVKWLVDGQRITGRTVHPGTKYSARISAVPGIRHVTVKVNFVRSSHTKARTIHAPVSGCRAVVPKFTG